MLFAKYLQYKGEGKKERGVVGKLEPRKLCTTGVLVLYIRVVWRSYAPRAHPRQHSERTPDNTGSATTTELPTTPRAHPQHTVSAAQPRDMKPSVLPSLLLLLLLLPAAHAVPIARRELQDSEPAEQSGSWSASSWDDSELADDPTYEPDEPEPEPEPTCTSGPLDDPSWDVGFGPCCTYARLGANADYCVSDGACDSCGSSCADQCLDSGSGWSATLGDHPVRVRIAGGGSSGVLEMAFDGGHWDAVCDDGFGGAEATAVCLTMGFDGGTAFDTTHGDSSFAADDIHCPSGARGLSQCTLGNSPYTHNCGDSETVGITCWAEEDSGSGW